MNTDKRLFPYGSYFSLDFDLEELSVLDMILSNRFQDDFTRSIGRKVRRILDNFDYYPKSNE